MNGQMRDVREIVREEMFMRAKVLAVLKEGPKTVPEIAKNLDYPASEVMYWVMSARKYGYLEEINEVTDEGYYKYQLVDNKGVENE
jgi:predicted transcriptional regulator